MPFLRAGFNARNRDTGIRAMTRAVGTWRGYKRAELRVFIPGGDFFWYGERFLAWPEQVEFRSWFRVEGGWQWAPAAERYSDLCDAPKAGASVVPDRPARSPSRARGR